MRKAWAALLALVLALTAAYLLAPHQRGAESRRPIPPPKYQKLLGVGIDVDWMTYKWVHDSYFYWKGRGVSIPALFKKRGFTNVRIRVNRDVTRDAAALRDLKEIVDDCLAAGINPVIAYTADDVRNNPLDPEAQAHFLKWWTTVAHAFRGYPYNLSYDLIIETSGEIKRHPQLLNKLYREALQEIRREDKYRIVILTPANTSSPFALKLLDPPKDPYIMVEWHIYAGGPKPSPGQIYDPDYILAAIRTAKAWSQQHGIPTWVGAWRPTRFNCKAAARNCPKYPDGAPKGIYPLQKVLHFTYYMSRKLRENNIPYDVNADTLFFNYHTATWYNTYTPILNAILNP